MTIRLLSIKVFAYHGAYPHEQENGANFEIDVEFNADLSEAVATDDLASTIDYASVYQMTYVLATNKKYKLIETLADTIARQILSTFAVSDVLVRVRKPEAEVGGPIGTVEVECRVSNDKVRAFIALGSNLEPREEHLKLALQGLETIAEVMRVSAVYESAPVGFTDQPAFLNAVVEIATDKLPLDLLEELKAMELAIGRKERPRWHEREIDFDIIFYGNCIFEDPALTIPHPEAHRRLFVLKPLADLDAKFAHPVLHRSVAELLRELEPDAAGIHTTDIQLR